MENKSIDGENVKINEHNNISPFDDDFVFRLILGFKIDLGQTCFRMTIRKLVKKT